LEPLRGEDKKWIRKEKRRIKKQIDRPFVDQRADGASKRRSTKTREAVGSVLASSAIEARIGSAFIDVCLTDRSEETGVADTTEKAEREE
jgi:hypothetical protein